MKHGTVTSHPTSLSKQYASNNYCSYRCGTDTKLQSNSW